MSRPFTHRRIWTAWEECLETLPIPGDANPCDAVDFALQLTMLTLLADEPAPDGWTVLATPFPPPPHAHLIALH
jgi:hypothetical protein